MTGFNGPPDPQVTTTMLFAALAGTAATSGAGMYAGAFAVFAVGISLYVAPTREEIVDEWASQYEVDDDG